ncbi:MAG: hypothetical protein MJ113_01775 [Lachnospiraceae bacterium]|nr:hypothetical protein [Lachnospiraceae bacterium]
MKISDSSIVMSSTHRESAYSYKESMTIEAAKSSDTAGAILSLSKVLSGKNLKETMAEYKKQQEEESKKKQKENAARSLQQMKETLKNKGNEINFKVPEVADMKIKMLKQILAALRGEKYVEEDCDKVKNDGKIADFRSASFKSMESTFQSIKLEGSVSLGNIEIGTNRTGTTWQKITAISGSYAESEYTTFASKGIVNTKDGRSIDFNVEIAMSRAFVSQIDSLEIKEYIKTDPLMINLDTNIGSVSDQKFYFDLDSDGKKEKISFAGKGSGFLAIDKNEDGKINDGSELFGTKSGDGFKDLSLYDEDGNGFIDESDSVFSKLKVWYKDEEGNDVIIDLKKADVGAIYLGNTNTQFSLKNENHELNAEIKKTGIYLHESTGEVGTLNHVDLAV